MKKKILFLIHDLGPRGAERVLVNLVNGMDRNQFDISVRTLFKWGPNIKALRDDVHYSSWFPRDIRANSHWMKLWSPEQLYRMIIPEKYDIVVAFLEGPCSRVVGGCPEDGTKTVCWIHTTMPDERKYLEGFRNKKEADRCYDRADALVFVSEDAKKAFLKFHNVQRPAVLHNIFDSQKIKQLALEEPDFPKIAGNELNWCSAGRLTSGKGWERMLNIQKRLIEEKIPAKFFILGDGPLDKNLRKICTDLNINDSVVFTGFQMNPYSYISRCILTVCASEREGFSTVAVESLLLGTPFCTVDVSGMREILGENGEYGVITDIDDESLYRAVRRFFTDETYREEYRQRAAAGGAQFDTEKAIKIVENYLLSL